MHVTLIDVAGVTHRRYGGAGFAVNTSPAEVVCERAETNALTWAEEIDRRDRDDAEALLDRLSAAVGRSFAVRVRSLPPQHAGFGSKTALFLAVCAACNIVMGEPLDADKMRASSCRGGASGVGVNTFFTGGLVVDLGHSRSSAGSFVPSSACQVFIPPPPAVRLPFPEEWEVHLFLPNGRKYAGGEEVVFFQKNTPIPGEEALKVLAAVYHGVVPAFVAHDLGLLREALGDIHQTGFKRRELEGQPAGTRDVIARCAQWQDVAVGMSSMGPLIYIIANVEMRDEIAGGTSALEEAGYGRYLGACPGRNSGYEAGGDTNG